MRLFNKDHTIRFRVAVIIGIVLGLFLFIGIHNYIHWHGGDYFGTISQMTENGFVITDANGRDRIVDLNKTTHIRRGPRSVQDGLRVGDRVIVVGDEGPDRHIQAALIRIVGGSNPVGTTTPN